MASPDLDRYFAASSKRGLNPFYERLEPFLPEPSEGWILEAGCGLGQGAEWFLNRGFSVEALDPHPRAIAETKQRLAQFAPGRYRLRQESLESADLATYSVIVGVFSFFFVPPDALRSTWEHLTDAVLPGGIIAGQLLGPEDDWANQLTTVTPEELGDWLAPFDVLLHDEVQTDGKTVTDEPKHWHVHHLILRKR